MTSDSYLRFPHVRGDQVVFVAEDDIWAVDRDGGRAFRVSADHSPAKSPRLSPDGSLVAWTSDRDGAFEVHVAPVDGGVSRRLTFWGQRLTLVRSWLSDAELLVVSTTGYGERQRAFAHAVPVDGSPSRRLPYGWLDDIALGPDGGVLLSTSTTVEPAWWKHYRGGTAAQLWLDRSGEGTFTRVMADLESSLVSPLWTTGAGGKQRIGFVSDHEGRGSVYSAALGARAPRPANLVRHYDGELYARHAASDGSSVVFVAGGALHVLDSLDPDARAREVEVRLGGPRSGLQPKRVKAAARLGQVDVDQTGRASVLESRGTVHLVAHQSGPVRALAEGSSARRRLPVLLGGTGRAAWVTDAYGDDAIEIVSTGDADVTPRVLVSAGKLGRVLELVASPDGRTLAMASHDGALRVVSVPTDAGARTPRVRVVDQAESGDPQQLAFSPDSRWIAWSAPGHGPVRQIKVFDLGGRGKPVEVTPLRFTDTEPTFTRDGKHLAFLSVRTLDPVYDSFVFDLSFPGGCRPHLVPLQADTPSPFDPQVDGRPVGGGDAAASQVPTPSSEAGAGSDDTATDAAPAAAPAKSSTPETRVDVAGLDQRIVPLPVPAGDYTGLTAVAGGLVWLKVPPRGVLGDSAARLDDEPGRPTLERIDFGTGKVSELAAGVDRVVASGDGNRILLLDKGEARVVPAVRKVEKDDPEAVRVDLDRVRIEVHPRAEWEQMLTEAWRLQRDHYWRADMNGIDWPAMLERYRPLVDRIATSDDFVDLVWEMHGELGTSHAYCQPALNGGDPIRRQGLLGADVSFVDDAWRIVRIVPGSRQSRGPVRR